MESNSWLTNQTPATLVWFQSKLDDRKSCYQLITTITISETKLNKCILFFFCERAFNTNYPAKIRENPMLQIRPLWKTESPRFSTRVRGCCYGLLINSVIGRLLWVHVIWLTDHDVTVQLQVPDYSQLSDYIVQLQPFIMISDHEK